MSEIPRADFHDEQVRLGWWQPRLESIGVRTPDTYSVELHRGDSGAPDWHTGDVQELLEQLGGEAFVRSDYKSAQMHLGEGSHIQTNTAEEIDRTLTELVSQHAMMQMPVGKALYLREWLDLNWRPGERKTCHPEARVFIRDGDVVCHHPRLEFRGDQEEARDIIHRDWNDEVLPMAERAAEEFNGDGWFSIDFVCATDCVWYATDMAVDALYERDDELRGISDHPGECPNDVERLAE